MSEWLRAQLYAVRAQIDAMLIGLGSESEPAAVEGCQHPDDHVVDNFTFDSKKRRCTLCGAEWDV